MRQVYCLMFLCLVLFLFGGCFAVGQQTYQALVSDFESRASKMGSSKWDSSIVFDKESGKTKRDIDDAEDSSRAWIKMAVGESFRFRGDRRFTHENQVEIAQKCVRKIAIDRVGVNGYTPEIMSDETISFRLTKRGLITGDLVDLVKIHVVYSLDGRRRRLRFAPVADGEFAHRREGLNISSDDWHPFTAEMENELTRFLNAFNVDVSACMRRKSSPR